MKNLKIATINNKIHIYVKDKCKKKFKPNIAVSLDDKLKCFTFAKNMAYGNKHNPDSFGSNNEAYKREKQKIFRDAFQGKIAEVAFYNCYSQKLIMENPNFDEWDRGIWEDTDFIIKYKNIEKRISIKSTKDFGNLLLLEKDRYDSNGLYIENATGNEENIKHDYIFLLRIKGTEKCIPNYYTEENLKKINIEVTGYIEYTDFIEAINKNRYLKRGWLISGKEELKVDNYYFCTSDLKNPKECYK